MSLTLCGWVQKHVIGLHDGDTFDGSVNKLHGMWIGYVTFETVFVCGYPTVINPFKTKRFCFT
jgi:hypothetical protein